MRNPKTFFFVLVLTLCSSFLGGAGRAAEFPSTPEKLDAEIAWAAKKSARVGSAGNDALALGTAGFGTAAASALYEQKRYGRVLGGNSRLAEVGMLTGIVAGLAGTSFGAFFHGVSYYETRRGAKLVAHRQNLRQQLLGSEPGASDAREKDLSSPAPIDSSVSSAASPASASGAR